MFPPVLVFSEPLNHLWLFSAAAVEPESSALNVRCNDASFSSVGVQVWRRAVSTASRWRPWRWTERVPAATGTPPRRQRTIWTVICTTTSVFLLFPNTHKYLSSREPRLVDGAKVWSRGAGGGDGEPLTGRERGRSGNTKKRKYHSRIRIRNNGCWVKLTRNGS